MNSRYSIEDMILKAKMKNGDCLSKSYRGQRYKLVWMCREGHTWKATPNSVIHLNSWCPYCAGNKSLDINLIRKIANQRGGECLTDSYINSKQKMLWECKKGHRWHASTFSIKTRSSWCPVCAKSSN